MECTARPKPPVSDSGALLEDPLPLESTARPIRQARRQFQARRASSFATDVVTESGQVTHHVLVAVSTASLTDDSRT